MVRSPIVVESAWGADHERQDYIRKEPRLEWLQTKASRSFSKPSSVELLTIGWLGSAYFGSGSWLEPSLAEPRQHYIIHSATLKFQTPLGLCSVTIVSK